MLKKKRNTTKRKYKSRVNITNAPKPFGEQNTARVPTKEESKLILPLQENLQLQTELKMIYWQKILPQSSWQKIPPQIIKIRQ
jgi:hypothetical protein